MLIAFYVLIAVLSASTTSGIAKLKKREPYPWAIAGLVFSVFAIPVALLWPSRKTDEKPSSIRNNLITGGASLIGAALILTNTNIISSIQGASYTCPGMVSEIVSLSAQQTGASAKILDIVNVSVVSTDDKNKVCRGLAIMSDQSKLNVTYKAYMEYDKWWIAYNFD